MNDRLEYQVITMQYLNGKVAFESTKMDSDARKRYSGYTKMRSDMNKIKTMLTHKMIQKKNSSTDNIYSTRAQDTSTVVLANNKFPPLECVHSTNQIFINSSPRYNSSATLI